MSSGDNLFKLLVMIKDKDLKGVFTKYCSTLSNIACMSAEGWILVLLRCGQVDKLDWSWRYHRCWAGLGWVSGTAATESREKNAMNSYSQTPPRPPRPALQSAALTHFQQETSHGCSLNAAGDVTSPGSGSGDGGMQGQGWRRPGYTMQSQDTLKVVNLHLTAGPGGGAGPAGHFSLDLHSYCKIPDDGGYLSP